MGKENLINNEVPAQNPKLEPQSLARRFHLE